MPRSNAAEAMPVPEQDEQQKRAKNIKKLIDEGVLMGPEEVRKNDLRREQLYAMGKGADEAVKKQEAEIEELPSDLLKELPPATPELEPTNDTKESLEELRKISIERDMEAAAEERKKILETRDKASSERMRRNMGASVLQELPPEDVKMEGEEETWTAKAARDLGPRKRMEPPPIPTAAKKPEAKKPWYKRLFGSKE